MTDRSTLETFSSVILDFHDSNNEGYCTVARHLTALKIALDTLSARYSSVNPAPGRLLSQCTSRIFPYPATFTPFGANEPSSFTYEGELEKRTFLFKGRTNLGQSICIKFVHRYGEDVHKWCAEHGFAPKLIGSEVLPGGWIMVIMELLDESWILLADTPDRGKLKPAIHEAIVRLHQKDMVHGDIRSTNIMVNVEKDMFMLVDYDWAGVMDKVKYPEFINTDPALRRPLDVRYDAFILPQHDIDMLENIFS